MEELERRVLEKHREELVADMAEVEPILDHLISTAVLRANDDNVQWIRSGHTALMRARKLLDILPSRQLCVRTFRGRDSFRSTTLVRTSHAVSRGAQNTLTRSVSPSPATAASSPARSKAARGALRVSPETKPTGFRCSTFSPTRPELPVSMEVFVTLSAIDFHDAQTTYERQKSLSAKQLRRLASKSWCEQLDSNAVEITDVSRLLRCPSGRVARSSLLLARAAGGKTLTLLKMAALWAEGGEDVLSQFEFVFYVECARWRCAFWQDRH